jgi:hypothetical protein
MRVTVNVKGLDKLRAGIEARNKFILDSFGHLGKQMNIEAWDRSAEMVKQAQEDYRAAVADRIMYYQCGYGL